MTDDPCANCGHPQHKHGDQIETYGCYAWDNVRTKRVCICEAFAPETRATREAETRRKHEEAKIFAAEKRKLGWTAPQITEALNSKRRAEEAGL